MRLLAPAPASDVCVVGDPDQAIYGFRGADPLSIQRFLSDYPGATVAPLTRNHRSPAPVVRAATLLIEQSPGRAPRPLEAQLVSATPVELVGLAGEREEADFLAAEIERVLGGTSFGSLDSGRADGNREALAWIDRWPDWPAPALALGGPPGCGKTHLLRIWAARAGAALMEGGDLEGKSVADLSEMIAASPTIAIDDAQRAPERALFHLYNLAREHHGHLLLVAEALPAHWRIALPDLASRLRAACASSGTNMSATPTTPSTAATSVRSVSGVPNSQREPTGFMNTIVENSTATRPDVAYCSAQ